MLETYTNKSLVFFSANISIVVGKIFYNPKETDTVTLNVNVVGIPSNIRWYKNNQLIKILNRYSGGSLAAPALTITDVRLSDGGEYVCEVTKGKDTIQSSTIQLSPICELFYLSFIYYPIFWHCQGESRITSHNWLLLPVKKPD